MLDVECAARLSSDFKDKNPYAFTGCTSRQSKGPIIQCFNDADIPLKASMFGDKKQTSVGFVVIDCKVDGYTRVPYACGPGDKYKVDKNALPLSERKPWPEDPDGAIGMFKCWPYTIVDTKPKNKDEREDSAQWEVHPGMVIRASFWSDAARGGDPKKFREQLCPAGMDVIPAFSVLEVELMCKGWSKWKKGDKTEDGKYERDISPVENGYGMGFNSINVLQGVSLHSLKGMLPKVLPPTLDASKAKNQKWQSKFHSIQNLVQADKVSFFVQQISQDASVDVDEVNDNQIRLGRWAPSGFNGPEASHFIDIPLNDALAATNSTDEHSACALLELAANAGALSMVVCCNQYRQGREQLRSMLFGYPIIDTRILLAAVQVPIDPSLATLDESGNYVVFETAFDVGFPAASPSAGKRKQVSSDDDEEEDAEEHAEEDEHDGREGSSVCEDISVMLRPKLLISKDVLTNIRGEHKVKTQDFMLVGNNTQLARGYYAKFVHPDLENQKLVLWGGYVSMVKPQTPMPGASAAVAAAASGGSKESVAAKKNKRNLMMMEESQRFDPFASASGGGGSDKKAAPAAASAAAAAPSGGSKEDKASKKKKGK